MINENNSNLHELEQILEKDTVKNCLIDDSWSIPAKNIKVDYKKPEIKIYKSNGICEHIPLSDKTSFTKGYVRDGFEDDYDLLKRYTFIDERGISRAFSFMESEYLEYDFKTFKRLVDKYSKVRVYIGYGPISAEYFIDTRDIKLIKRKSIIRKDTWNYEIHLNKSDHGEIYFFIESYFENQQINDNTFTIYDEDQLSDFVTFYFMNE